MIYEPAVSLSKTEKEVVFKAALELLRFLRGSEEVEACELEIAEEKEIPHPTLRNRVTTVPYTASEKLLIVARFLESELNAFVMQNEILAFFAPHGVMFDNSQLTPIDNQFTNDLESIIAEIQVAAYS